MLQHGRARLSAGLVLAVLLGLFAPSAVAATSMTFISPERSFSPNGDAQDDTYYVRFNLSQPSNVTVAVADELGVSVRTLVAGQSFPSGYSSMEWDGRDDSGAVVAAGLYEVRATAVAADGSESSDTIATEVDFNAPGTLTAPAPSAALSGDVDLVVSPTSGVDVYQVSWSLPGCSGWSATTPRADGAFAASVNVSTCATGDQQLSTTVYWRDRFNSSHSTALAGRPVTVTDDAAPEVALYSRGRQVVGLSSPGVLETSSVYLSCRDGSQVSWSWVLTNAAGEVVRTYPDTSPSACDYYYDVYQSVDGIDDAGNQLPDGEYTLTATATDAGGLSTDLGVPFEIDSRLPGTLTTPLASAALSGDVDLVVSPTSGVDVYQVSWSLPGCSGWSATTPRADGAFAASVNVSTCATGDQQLSTTVYWRDRFNSSHSTALAGRPVTVTDDAAPEVALYSRGRQVVGLSSPGVLETSSVYLSCRDGSQVSWSWVLTNAAGEVVRTYPDTSPSACDYYYDVYQSVDGIDDAGNQLPDGEYTLTATATDAGGLSTDLGVPFEIDSRLPGTLTTPACVGCVVG